MSTLGTRFGRATVLDRQEPLTNDQIMRVAPSVFAVEPHNSRSERYTYIPTIDVLDGLRNEGFEPFYVAQSKSRIEGKSEYTKHMLRLRKTDQIVGSEANEIILINSHDGTSSYKMLAGCFRFVCCNGMVCGDIIDDIKIMHKGNIIDNVIEAAYEIVDDFEPITESIELMKSIELTEQEQRLLAKTSLSLKYDDPLDAPIRPERLLTPRRYGDDGNSAWSTFNRIQEHMLRGGDRGRTANGRRTSTREIKNIDKSVKLNRALWVLADEMAKIKGV